MLKQFFRYVLPSMLAFLFSGLYCIVDGFFVGRSVGNVGLAAISIAFPLSALIMAVGTGIGMGGAVQISISRGRGQPDRENAMLGGTFSLLAVSSIALTVLMFLVCRPVLVLLGAQGEVLEAALSYIRIIIAGAIFQTLATGFVPLLRNYGAAMLAMGTMIAGFVTNIILDWLFVFVFGWGMAGAAWATIIGQAVTILPCIPFLVKKIRLLKRGDFRLRKDIVSEIIKTGASPFGLTMSPNIVLMLMNKSASVYGGANGLAAYAVIGYVCAIIQSLLQGIGDGCQPLLSLYSGMGDTMQIKKTRNIAYVFSAVTALATTAGVLLLRGSIPAFFGASGEAAPLVAQALPIFAVEFVLIAFCRITTSYFYATEKNRSAYLMVYGEPLILSVLLTLGFPRFWGLNGVWISAPSTLVLLVLIGIGLLLWDRVRSGKTEHLPTAAPEPCRDPAEAAN